MKLASIAAVIVGFVGCSAPAPKATPEHNPTQAFRWSEVLDAVWDTVENNKQVWVDEIQRFEGKMMDQNLKAMDPDNTITGGNFGILLRCHLGGADVKPMTAFRRELKENPTLSRLCPIVNFGSSWRLEEHEEPADKYSLHFDVLLVSRE